MEKKILQISISNLIVDRRGPNDDREDVNLFRFTLSYPAEGVSGLETIKTVKADKPIPTNWTEDFDKSILFKTQIRGKSKLSIEVASIDKQSKTEKALSKLFGNIFGAVLGVWTGGFGSAYVGAVTKTLGGSILDMVEDDEDVDIVGVADVLIDSENITNSITLPLEVKKAVVRKITKRNPERGSARRTVRVEEVVIPVGTNGSIAIQIDVIG